MPRIKKIVSNSKPGREAAFQIREEFVRWDNVKTAHDLVDDMEVARILLNCYDLVGEGFLVWSDKARIGLYTTLRLKHVTPEGVAILEEIKALGGWDSDNSPRRRKSRRQPAQVRRAYEEKEEEDDSLNSVRQPKKRKTGRKHAGKQAPQVPKAKVTVKVKSEPEENEREPELDKAGRESPEAQFQEVTVKEEPINEDVVDVDFDRYGLNLEDPKDDDYELEKESSSEDEEEAGEKMESTALSSCLPQLPSASDAETAEMSKKERKKKPKPRPKQHSSTSQNKAKEKGASERKAKLPREVKPRGEFTSWTYKVYDCRHCSVRKDTLNNLKDHFNEKHMIFNKQSAKESEKQPEGTEDRLAEDQVLKNRAFQSNCDVNIRLLCVICSEILKYRKEHVKQHDWTDKGARKCFICGKVCYTLTALYAHKKVHEIRASGVTFDCKICGKSCSTPRLLRLHMEWHTTERPHMCDVCGKAFKVLGALRKHKLIHAKTMPYICPHCGRGFNHESNFRGHLRIHTGEKPYKCDICSAAFNHNVSLKSHKKSAHGVDMWKDPVNRRFASHEETTKTPIAASIDDKTEDKHPNTVSQSCNKSRKNQKTAHNKAEFQQASTDISYESKASEPVRILEKEKTTTSYSAIFSQYHNLSEIATKSDLTSITSPQETSNLASHTTDKYSSSEQHQPSSLVPPYPLPMPVHHPLSHMPTTSAGDYFNIPIPTVVSPYMYNTNIPMTDMQSSHHRQDFCNVSRGTSGGTFNDL